MFAIYVFVSCKDCHCCVFYLYNYDRSSKIQYSVFCLAVQVLLVLSECNNDYALRETKT